MSRTASKMLLAPLLSDYEYDEESSSIDCDTWRHCSICRLSSAIKRVEEPDASKDRGTDTPDTELLSEEDDSNNAVENALCCDDENCGDRLANANFFLPTGVVPTSSTQSDRNCICCKYCERCNIVHHVHRHVSSARTLSTPLDEEKEEVNKELISTVGRSHITAQGICCASEIHMIQSILLPIEGVVSVKVSPTTKAIYIDHDINIVSASQLCHALDEGGFTSTLITDAAVEITQQIGIPLDMTVESVFDMIKTSSTDLKEKEVSSKLKLSFGEEGIIQVSLDVDGASLTIEHNPYYVTATQISHSLRDSIEGYTITINKDGGEGGRWAMKGEESEYETKRPKVDLFVILSGVLCAISFLG